MGHSSPKLIASQRLTVSLHPPTIHVPHPILPRRRTISVSSLRSLALSRNPSSCFSLVLTHTHTHARVLLAPRRTRHVLPTYIVPPNNVCPEGREITDFVGVDERRTSPHRRPICARPPGDLQKSAIPKKLRRMREDHPPREIKLVRLLSRRSKSLARSIDGMQARSRKRQRAAANSFPRHVKAPRGL